MKKENKDAKEIKEAVSHQKKEQDEKCEHCEKLKKEALELVKKAKEIEEITNIAKRIQADFENYKKRVEKEKLEFMQFASAGLVKELLPVLDSLEASMKQGAPEELALLHKQLKHILESKGLKPIPSENCKFDPFMHEALIQEESVQPEGNVTGTIQEGYTFQGCVLRPARVKVSKKKAEAKKNEGKAN